VQVHPNDEYAQKHEAAGAGKTEMWYTVAARAGAEVKAGLKPGIGPDAFRRAIAASTVEDCLETIPVRAGDAIFVPAGTVHTIGPGATLCEIQEYSDITYRIFDYNRLTAEGRPRALHIEQAFAVVNFAEQSGGKIEPVRLERGPVEETYFVACRYFATEKWEFTERVAAATSCEHFDLLIVLVGSGQIEFGSDAVDYAPAQAWLVPAALGAYQLSPAARTSLLRTYVPDSLDGFVRRLADRGVPEAAWSRLVYP
jgi:mannose-6-phosphate isomerase